MTAARLLSVLLGCILMTTALGVQTSAYQSAKAKMPKPKGDNSAVTEQQLYQNARAKMPKHTSVTESNSAVTLSPSGDIADADDRTVHPGQHTLMRNGARGNSAVTERQLYQNARAKMPKHTSVTESNSAVTLSPSGDIADADDRTVHPSQQTLMRIGARGVEDYGSDRRSVENEEIDFEPQAAKGRDGVSSVWMTFHKKVLNPGCNEQEFKHSLGMKDSLEECLDAVKDSKHVNVGIWERGLGQNCYACDLHGRGKAASLSYIDSPHIDAFVKFSGLEPFYTNSGNEFMKTPGQWRVNCKNLPNTTKYITTKYGSKVDYFKPITGETFCTMLVSNQKHLTSSDGADDSWGEPAYGTGKFCGGSAAGDVGTWCTMKTGKGDPQGGLINGTWNHDFEMHYMREYVQCAVFDGTAPTAYSCECGNTHCSAGEACTRDISLCRISAASAASGTSAAPATGGTSAAPATGGTSAAPVITPNISGTSAPTNISGTRAGAGGAGADAAAKQRSVACPTASSLAAILSACLMWHTAL